MGRFYEGNTDNRTKISINNPPLKYGVIPDSKGGLFIAKKEVTAVGILRAIATGGILAGVLSFALALVLAMLLSKGTVPEQSIPVLAVIIAVLSGGTGAYLAAAMAKQKRLPSALGAGVVYVLLLLAARGIWFGGEWYAMPMAAALGGAVLTGLLSAKKKKRRAY